MKCPKCRTEDHRSIDGAEVRGIYDGILFWVCKECDHAFPRDHGVPYRNIKSEIYAEKYNDNRPKQEGK